MTRRFKLILACALLGLLPSPTHAAIELISDFNDGLRTGWTTVPVFHGGLFADANGGNLGGFMFATDIAGGGFLYVKYVAKTFDLNDYSDILWDEYVYSVNRVPHSGTSALLLADDGTIFRSAHPLEKIAEWNARSVSFDPANWYQPSTSTGLSTFEQVLANATIGLSMDTSYDASGNRESGVDNVRLVRAEAVPEPGSLAVWGFGLVLFLALQRRRRKA